MSSWKQPVPVDDSEFPRPILFTLYCMLIIKSANKDGMMEISNGKLIPIKRGQTVFGRNKWCKFFDLSPSGVERLLKTLEKVTGKVTCERTFNCTIVTITDYDQVVSMEQEKEQDSNRTVTGGEQESNTSKSVNTVKSVKSDNNIYNPKPTVSVAYQNFVDKFNEITGKKHRYGDKKAAQRLQLRLKEGYTREDLERAIRNCFNDPFHKENPKYLTPEFITRSDKLEMYLNTDVSMEVKVQNFAEIQAQLDAEIAAERRK